MRIQASNGQTQIELTKTEQKRLEQVHNDLLVISRNTESPNESLNAAEMAATNIRKVMVQLGLKP